jgi:hypothetical protein
MRPVAIPTVSLLALAACTAAFAASPVPTPIGVGAAFHPPPTGPEVGRGIPVAGLVCGAEEDVRVGAHLEVFAAGRVVIVPAGIGIAPPFRRQGPYVLVGRCSYAARTREPTGVIELARSHDLTLGAFFRLWGRQLGRRQLAGFGGGQVRVYVNGQMRRGDPRTVRLRRHDQVVLQIGPYVRPHVSYRFQKGL